MLFGFGSETGAWTSSGAPPMPPGPWHNRQLLSLAIAPPLCSVRPAGGGLTKLLSSWQAPQARRLGTFQLAAIGAGLLGAGLRWHFVQLRMSCGYVTSYGCGRPAYVPPRSASLSPMWIL